MTTRKSSKPSWNGKRHELCYHCGVVKHIERPAPNLELVLASFQELGWPERMDNPLPGSHKIAHEHLRDVIKKLNPRNCQLAHKHRGITS